jgi:hypothetical protein
MVFVIAGVLSIMGVRRRWGWLVDPPDELWLVHSQSMIKKRFGKEALASYTMFTGVTFTILGALIVAIGMWRALSE